MTDEIFTVISNSALTGNVYKMVLGGKTSAITAPGQFINIKLDGFYLRRPISVCDCDEQSVTIIYKTVGVGTEYMKSLAAGEKLSMLTGLGNGFEIKKSGDKPLLIGGGVGVPPMYMLAKELIKAGAKPRVIMGFNTSSEVFYYNEFSSLGCDVIIATADGSTGVRGFVTDGMKTVEDYSFFYACGPLPMLKAVSDCSKTSGELSFEERMGCGFGACMGCSCKTKYGNKRICRDGPVLEKEEVIW